MAVGVEVLAQDNVVHFDLKCDNVLLEPVAGAAEDEFWRPGSARPPFRVVLADFGESRMYASADGAVTIRCVPTTENFFSRSFSRPHVQLKLSWHLRVQCMPKPKHGDSLHFSKHLPWSGVISQPCPSLI